MCQLLQDFRHQQQEPQFIVIMDVHTLLLLHSCFSKLVRLWEFHDGVVLCSNLGQDQRCTLQFQMHLLAIHGHPASCLVLVFFWLCHLDVGSVLSCVIGYPISYINSRASACRTFGRLGVPASCQYLHWNGWLGLKEGLNSSSRAPENQQVGRRKFP